MTTNKAQEEKARVIINGFNFSGDDGGGSTKAYLLVKNFDKHIASALASAERDAVERTIERCRRIALDLKDKHLDYSLKYLGGYIEACEEIAEVIKTINLKPKG